MLEHCQEIAHTIESGTLLMHLGACLGYGYVLSGRVDDAVRVQEGAHRLATEATNIAWLPIVCAHSAEAFTSAGRKEDALRLARQGIDLGRKHHSHGQEAWALAALARALSECGAPAVADADASYVECLALTRELGMRPLEARCHLARGALSMRSDNLAQAREHLNSASAMYREMGTPFWLQKSQAILEGRSCSSIT